MGIGTLRENSLHAEIKRRIYRDGDILEAPVGKYHIDIARGSLLIEIQTRNFSAVRLKLEALLKDYSVLLIHPVAVEKKITRISRDGEVLGSRKSPRRGGVHDLFFELVSMPHLALHPRFSLSVMLIREEEIVREDGKGSWRRKRRSIADRRLVEVLETREFSSPTDYLSLLPAELAEEFTTELLGASISRSRPLAGKITYCLRKMGVLTVTGKRRNALVYARPTIDNPRRPSDSVSSKVLEAA